MADENRDRGDDIEVEGDEGRAQQSGVGRVENGAAARDHVGDEQDSIGSNTDRTLADQLDREQRDQASRDDVSERQSNR